MSKEDYFPFPHVEFIVSLTSIFITTKATPAMKNRGTNTHEKTENFD